MKLKVKANKKPTLNPSTQVTLEPCLRNATQSLQTHDGHFIPGTLKS